MPTTTFRSSYRYHITLRTYNLSAHATGANESMRALRVYIFTDGASQRTYVFVAHVTVRRRALLHVHPTSHGTLVPSSCAPSSYQVAAWCREVHWLKSALAARDKVWACARASVMCASRFCLLFATTTVYAPCHVHNPGGQTIHCSQCSRPVSPSRWVYQV